MKRFFALLFCAVIIISTIGLCGCNEKGQTTIKYADAQSIMEMLIDDTLSFGLLPEPAATKLEKVKGKDYTWNRLDLQELYDEETKAYPQAVLMVKKDVAENYPDLVREIENKFTQNLESVKENPASAVNAIKEIYSATSLVPAKVISKEVVEACKIYWESAAEAKNSVEKYIDDILGIDVGLGINPAVQPESDFYYAETGASGQSASGKTFTFYVPDGAPALAVANFISTNQSFVEGATFNYNVVNAEEIATYMNGANTQADFIILPVNAATLNYKKGAGYKMVSVITHGNLYIVSKAQTDINGLIDADIGVIGKGKVPDLTLKAVLKKNNIGYKESV